MKQIIKHTFIFLIKNISVLYSYETNKVLKNLKNKLYSYWLKNSIKTCGNGFSIQSPAYIKGAKYMTIGDGFVALERLRIECWDSFAGFKFNPNIIIGNNVCLNYNVHIGCNNKVIIGNNVLFASNIYITDHQHGYIDKRDLGITPASRPLFSKGPVVIEDNVWIGENVAIMPNVTIGEGCIIGANSVVTKSFPCNSVLAGIPAKILRSLD